MDDPTLSLDQLSSGWDEVVEGYEEAATSLTGSFIERLLQHADLQSGEQVLDVAAGTGVLSLAAAERGAQVLATDFSPLMIEKLQAKIRQDEAGGIEAQVMDGQALALEDARYDIAFSNFGMIFFPDPEKGLREMHRVLKPGGRVAVSAWSAPENIEFMTTLLQAILRVVPDFSLAQPPVWLRFQDPAFLHETLEKAGYRDVQVHTHVQDWPLPSPRWLPERLLGVAPPMKVLMEQFEAQQQQDILEEMANIIQDIFDQGRSALANEAHIAIGIK
jgi:SAM-dependent methyltransferase